MTIHIEDLKFQCIIGILDFERVKTQDVIVNIEIEYNFNNEFINYASVVSLIKSSMITDKFFLIEDALTTLSTYLKDNFTMIDKLFIKITKPSILPDSKVSVSNIYIFNS